MCVSLCVSLRSYTCPQFSCEDSPDGNKVLIQEGTSASVDIVDEVKKATQAAADVKGFIQEQRRSTEDNAECDKTLTDVVSKVAGMIQTVKPADSTKADTSLASIAEKVPNPTLLPIRVPTPLSLSLNIYLYIYIYI